MAIVGNEPCPQCQLTGHDSKGNHLLVFDDGGRYCKHREYHPNNEPYFIAPEAGYSITNAEVTGKIKYSPSQFRELEKDGKLKDAFTRERALAGMREQDRWQVMNEHERADLELLWEADLEHLESLPFAHLASRGIRGEIAKLYGIRVGRGEDRKVHRHYYPKYEAGVLIGAKCRTLPKSFSFGHLGRQWANKADEKSLDMFGEHTLKEVLDSGRRTDKLLLVGGELDAAAAQQMLVDSQKGTKYEGTLFHVWSVPDGEGIECIRERKQAISQFKEILLCFDQDDTGKKLTEEVSKIFSGKCKKVILPTGLKDPNDCLLKGYAKSFVDAWWNPKDVFEGVRVKSVSAMRDQLKQGLPANGVGWPWPDLDKYTLKIRPHTMIVYGAGSGVGKTEFLRSVAKHVIEEHGHAVGVISTEDPYVKVARSFIGKWINKRIELPATRDKADPSYRKLFDYTEDEANSAIDYVADKNLLFFADLTTSRDIKAVMEQIEEFYTMGVQHIIIDNLTGIEVKEGGNSEREGIDEVLMTLGLYKDAKPITIHLISHLKTVGQGRVPHEEGGEVLLSDYRGSRSIGFWASYAIAIRRNTRGETLDERTTTFVEIVKDRDQGIYTGSKVVLIGDEDTGELLTPAQRSSRLDLKQETGGDFE